MAVSKENLAGVNGQNDRVSQGSELDSPAKDSLEGLLTLLADLKIITLANEPNSKALAPRDELLVRNAATGKASASTDDLTDKSTSQDAPKPGESLLVTAPRLEEQAKTQTATDAAQGVVPSPKEDNSELSEDLDKTDVFLASIPREQSSESSENLQTAEAAVPSPAAPDSEPSEHGNSSDVFLASIANEQSSEPSENLHATEAGVPSATAPDSEPSEHGDSSDVFLASIPREQNSESLENLHAAEAGVPSPATPNSEPSEHGDAIDAFLASIPTEPSSGTSDRTEPSWETSEDADALVGIFRNLLIEPHEAEVREIVGKLEQKLATIEQKTYEPTELFNLLLPSIAELVEGTVKRSHEAAIEALAPIIDEVIQHKTQDNRQSMGLALAAAIPVAISQQVQQAPTEVANAIAPEIAAAIKEQIRLERDAMVDALYPVIGSTIATYMAAEVRAINEKLENALSVEGVTRKFRAKLRGVSEAEMLFKEAMPFRVRAIFLIHKASGLVISEVQPSDGQILESDMVAGMLTAIRSFVNDCIAQSGDVAEIDEIDYGTSRIRLEVAGYCYLAGVVQGEPPRHFLQRIHHALGSIVQNYGKSIETYEGDPTTVPHEVNGILQGLIDESSEVKPRKPPALLIVSLVVLGLIFVPWGIFWYKGTMERRIEAKAELALASAPELSVYRLDAEVRGDKLQLSGRVPSQYLRSKAAQIVASAKPTQKIINRIVAVEVPRDPTVVAAEVKRVASLLNQMDAVAIAAQYAGGSVTVEGKASKEADADTITRSFRQIPGVKSVNSTLSREALTIPTQVYFDVGSTEVTPTDLNPKIVLIEEYLNQYPEKHLRIIGHTDPSGNPAENEKLALRRGQTVRDALIERGIEPERIQTIGKAKSDGNVNADRPLWLSRTVEFELFTPISKK